VWRAIGSTRRQSRFKRLEAANEWYKFKSSHFQIPNATLAVERHDETAKLPVPARRWHIASAAIGSCCNETVRMRQHWRKDRGVEQARAARNWHSRPLKNGRYTSLSKSMGSSGLIPCASPRPAIPLSGLSPPLNSSTCRRRPPSPSSVFRLPPSSIHPLPSFGSSKGARMVC